MSTSTIFELKKQIYSEISNLTCNVLINKLENDYFSKIGKQDNFNTQGNMELNIKNIKLEQNDIKDHYYCITFELCLTINTNFNEYNEISVYNVLENILKLLSTMEFYYCYNLSNQDIRSTIDTSITESSTIKVEWNTNLHINNNLFN